MKIYIKSLLLLGMFLIHAACADQLDLEPQNNITEEIAITDEESLQSLLVGAYDRMADDDLYGGWIQMTADLLGTDFDVTWNGTFVDPGDIYNKAITASNGQAEVTWTEAYEAINVCNLILANLSLVTTAEEKARMEGEAKFIRGALYFDLVRLYAKDWADGNPALNPGVPIKLQPTSLSYNAAANIIPRSTVAEVYALAIADLTAAETLLPESNSVYATTYAAKGMLARLYLQQRRYDNARNKANDIIESGVFDLVKTVDLAFNHLGNNSEDVFGIQITNQDGENALQTFYASNALNGRRDIRLRVEYEELFDDDDERKTKLIYFDAVGRRLSGKYQKQFANISLIRLAEMYLIRAEGNFIIGDQVGPNTPEQDLQELRTRAHAATPAAVATIDDIMLERKLELAFEGHFVHDVKRKEATTTQRGVFQWNADELVLPIPQREVDSNPALTGHQNPGYGI